MFCQKISIISANQFFSSSFFIRDAEPESARFEIPSLCQSHSFFLLWQHKSQFNWRMRRLCSFWFLLPSLTWGLRSFFCCKRSRDLLPQMVCCATGTIEPSYLHILSRLVPILLRWEIVAPFPYKNRLLCTVCLSDCVRLCAILYLCVLLSFTCPPTICNCQKYTVLPGGRKLG